jgi:hypothetical protein
MARRVVEFVDAQIEVPARMAPHEIVREGLGDARHRVVRAERDDDVVQMVAADPTWRRPAGTTQSSRALHSARRFYHSEGGASGRSGRCAARGVLMSVGAQKSLTTGSKTRCTRIDVSGAVL